MKLEVSDQIINSFMNSHLRYFNTSVTEALEYIIKVQLMRNSVEGYTVDELTGCHNRSILSDRIAGLIPDRSTPGEVVTFIAYCFDVNNFKQFLDKSGLSEGDVVLRKLGKTLNEVFGIGNVVRFGGDEFVAILKKPIRRVPISFSDDVDLKLVQVNFKVALHENLGHILRGIVELEIEKAIAFSTLKTKKWNRKVRIKMGKPNRGLGGKS